MEKKIYDTRVVPLVMTNEKFEKIDNLSNEEIKNMSCDPRILWQNSDRVYMAEMPLAYKGGTGIKWSLYYVFNELTKEEQAKYFDRSVVIRTTIKDVVQVYEESSKRFFGKKKTKRKY